MAEKQREPQAPVHYKHVSFRAQSHAGEWITLEDDAAKRYERDPGRTRVFAQTAQRVTFSASEMFDWYLRRTTTKAVDYCPATIGTEGRIEVEFPIGFPPGAFHIATDDGDVDMKRLVLTVAYSRAAN